MEVMRGELHTGAAGREGGKGLAGPGLLVGTHVGKRLRKKAAASTYRSVSTPPSPEISPPPSSRA